MSINLEYIEKEISTALMGRKYSNTEIGRGEMSQKIRSTIGGLSPSKKVDTSGIQISINKDTNELLIEGVVTYE
jgi:hypothetical protein